MTNPRSTRVRAAAVAGVLALALVACGNDDGGDTADDTTTTAADTSDTTEASTDGGGGAGDVLIEDFDFGAPITVAAGETFTVANGDSAPHTFSEQGGAFTTGTIPAGDSAQLTIDEPGTYEIFCEIHPSMEGSITVT